MPNEKTEALAKRVLEILKDERRTLTYSELEILTGAPKGRSMDSALKLLKKRGLAVFVRDKEVGSGWEITAAGKKA